MRTSSSIVAPTENPPPAEFSSVRTGSSSAAASFEGPLPLRPRSERRSTSETALATRSTPASTDVSRCEPVCTFTIRAP
jgi:hypothetical protein